MEKAWDLNIYFLEELDEEAEEYVNSKTLRINPVLWTQENGISDVTYSNWYIETTFAETRFIQSQYPVEEYGYDWTDSLEGFLKVAPPRLRQVLLAIPPAERMTTKKVLDLVG